MQTNYEKIKAMSIDEMAELFSKNCHNMCVFKHYEDCLDPFHDCKYGIKQWLESEVE